MTKQLTKLTKRIIDTINFKENATIVGFRDDGLYEIFEEIIYNKDLGKKIRTNTNEQVKFTKFPLNLALKTSKKEVYEKIGISFNIETNFDETISQNELIVLVVENIDQLENPYEHIQIIDELISKYRGKIIFFYLLQNVETLIKLQDRLSANSSFFDNIIYQDLESEREKEYLEWYCESKYSQKLSRKQLDSIFKQSSGHYELYKKLYKAEILTDDSTLVDYTKRLVRDLGANTLTALRKLLLNMSLSPYELQIIEYLRRLGFVTNTNQISIKIFEQYILDLAVKEKINFDENSKQITFGDIENFTKNEINILNYLFINKGKLTGKEDLGRIIWTEDEFNEKYSDWALDQAIFRLRKKVEKYNIDCLIETVHGKGYILKA